MTPEQEALVSAVDELEDALAAYFADKDIPLEIQRAVSKLEAAMSEAGLSPLEISGLAQTRV